MLPARRRALFVAWMSAAIVAVAGLAFWDEQRESAAALADFAEEQATTARALGTELAPRLAAAKDEAEVTQIVASVTAVELPRAVVVLLRRSDRDGLVTTAGTLERVPPIEEALARGVPSVRLSRPQASSLGLPARTAMAGLATIDAGGRGSWGIAVIATAERERNREQRAGWRLLLGVAVASGLVLVFGGAALARERKELVLARELAIAERDERLERAAKLAALGALATGIAHEVSTPLGVIVGRAEQLASKVKDDERATRAVQAILDQAERVNVIVRGILALVRGDNVAFERAEAGRIAQAAAELVEHRFEKAGVALTRADRSSGAMFACEARLFEQVLVNLLLNACDACARGGHVELSVASDAESVVFAVTDDGAGIAPDVVARAMEPFVSTKGAAGSGMGLAIAAEIVKHHRGSLALAPRDDARGTRARVTVPLSLA